MNINSRRLAIKQNSYEENSVSPHFTRRKKKLHAQQPYVYTIKADSVKITNICDTAELIIENHTQTVSGFLYNKGKGRTEFRRGLVKINGNKYVVGSDTLDMSNVWLQGGNAFGSAGVLGTTDNNDLRLFTNNTEKVHITADGRVGIGTANPAAKLHIVDSSAFGNAYVLLTTTSNTFSRYEISNSNSGVSAGAGMLYFNNVNQGLQCYMGSTNNAFVPSGALIRMTGTGALNIVTDNGVIAFGRSPYAGLAEFARFLNNGNFGIGTQTPQVKLHVIGKGIFTDTLTATTMDITDNSSRVATTAFVKNAIGAPALSVISASAADITATAGALIRLPDLTGAGSHSVILPAASLYSGQRIYLWNMNSSGNSWTFSSSITLPNGTTTTSIVNQSAIELNSDGAVWLKWN